MCRRSAKPQVVSTSKEHISTTNTSITNDETIDTTAVNPTDCWVQCDSCKKWRIIGSSEQLLDRYKNNFFTCDMNDWDEFKSCDVAEQQHFSETVDWSSSFQSEGAVVDEDDENETSLTVDPSSVVVSINTILKGKNKLDDITWQYLWKYLRTAPSLPAVRERLNEVVALFPMSVCFNLGSMCFRMDVNIWVSSFFDARRVICHFKGCTERSEHACAQDTSIYT
jgi:hypothetical protein